MKILNCLYCEGELDIVGEEGIRKLVKCRSCGFTSKNNYFNKSPEIVIIKRKINTGNE